MTAAEQAEDLWALARQVYAQYGHDPVDVATGPRGGPVVWVDGDRPAELVELYAVGVPVGSIAQSTVVRVYYLTTRTSGTPAVGRFRPAPADAPATQRPEDVDPSEVTTCKSKGCQAPIVFAKSRTTGQPAPYDATPSPAGTWRIDRDLFGDLEAVNVGAGSAPGLRVSHFATCPDAPSWRRREATQ